MEKNTLETVSEIREKTLPVIEACAEANERITYLILYTLLRLYESCEDKRSRFLVDEMKYYLQK